MLTVKRKSRICEGNGLFAVQVLEKGMIVGVTGGIITEMQSQWTVELTKKVWVDGYPTGQRDVTQSGYGSRMGTTALLGATASLLLPV
jgi:hypothetical protein